MTKQKIKELIEDYAIDNKCLIDEAIKQLITESRKRLKTLRREVKELKSLIEDEN